MEYSNREVDTGIERSILLRRPLTTWQMIIEDMNSKYGEKHRGHKYGGWHRKVSNFR